MTKLVVICVVVSALITLAFNGMWKFKNEYANSRQEIIARLWLPQDRPEDVTSVEIAKRLKELDIDVNR